MKGKEYDWNDVDVTLNGKKLDGIKPIEINAGMVRETISQEYNNFMTDAVSMAKKVFRAYGMQPHEKFICTMPEYFYNNVLFILGHSLQDKRNLKYMDIELYPGNVNTFVFTAVKPAEAFLPFLVNLPVHFINKNYTHENN